MLIYTKIEINLQKIIRVINTLKTAFKKELKLKSKNEFQTTNQYQKPLTDVKMVWVSYIYKIV